MRARETRRAHERAVDIHSSEASVVDRLRKGLAEAGLDCRCERRADAVFAQVDRIRRQGALEDVRRMRDAIAVVLVLLAEVDELTPDERDLSAFEEIATLFEDVADFAERGATFSRVLAWGDASSDGSPVQ